MTGDVISSGGQGDYEETPYEDQSWEIIGDLEEDPQFNAMELEVLRSHEFRVDPMFADYGGTTDSNVKKKWHQSHSNEVCAYPREDTPDPQKIIEELKAAHQQELQKVREQALTEGKEAGKQEALQAQQEKDQKLNTALQQFLEDFQTQVVQAMGKIEANAVKFSLEVAKKIIDTAVDVNPEYIIKIVNEALEHAGTSIVQRVRVSPQDYEFIEVMGVRKLMTEYDGSWDFEADQSVRAGCIVETTAGEIDYQLDEAWERIKEQVVKVS